MGGFKQNYLITYNGKTDNFIYQDLQLELTTPYDWDKTHDVKDLFDLIRYNIQKDFDSYNILSVEKSD